MPLPLPSLDDESATRVMGERMLSGWTMLEHICPMPHCSMPLLRHPDHGTECVRCQLPCVNEIDAEKMHSKPSSPSLIAEQQKQIDVCNDDWQPPSDEQMRVIRQRSEQRDRMSALMAEKMLCGWTMLNAHCTNSECGLPLLAKNEGEQMCVSCNSNSNTLADASSATPMNSVSENSPSTASLTQSQNIMTRQNRSRSRTRSHQIVFDQCRTELLAKMTSIRSMLAALTGSEVSTIIQLANALKELAQAYDALTI